MKRSVRLCSFLAIVCLGASGVCQTKHSIKQPAASGTQSCRIDQTDRPLISYYSGSPNAPELIKVFSGEGTDVYIDPESKDSIHSGRITVPVRLYFIFRDEMARKQAIDRIRIHPPFYFDSADSGTFKTKPVVKKLDWLKYVVMYANYSHEAYIQEINYRGPYLVIGSSMYLAPLSCTGIKYNSVMKEMFSDKEVIWYDGLTGAGLTDIGTERLESDLHDACTTCGLWSLLAGDPTPGAPPVGYFGVRLDTPQTTFLREALDAAWMQFSKR